MTMSATTLANELKAMALYDNEAAAAAAWAQAFANYFQGVNPPTDSAESLGVPIAPAAIPAAQTAMQGGLSGMSGSGAGAAKIQAAILLFWGALVPGTAWPTVTVITPPPGLSGISAALQSVFDDNRDNEEDKDTALTAIADAIHGINGTGGLATWPGPVQEDIT